jgi:putative DNA primase/helicase
MSSFQEALEIAGIIVSGSLHDDEQIHRLPTRKKPGGKNGWYVLYEGGKAGNFGNWENGDESTFWYDDAVRPEDYREKREKVRKNLDAEKEASSQKAADYVDGCDRAGHSDYLFRKQIKANSARFDGGAIVIPAQDANGKIWSYQKIYGDGTKYFMPGGRIKACYFTIASKPIDKSDMVVVCEGFATGAAIHEATGLPVLVAFSANNLKPVCDSVPYTNILVAADNDESGVGEEMAKNTGRRYVMPVIAGWDFSDMAMEGKDIKKYFEFDAAEASEIEAHGLVAEIANWITSTAVRPQPLQSLAAALSFVGMMKGHRYATPSDLRSNLLILNISPTASGKEHPQNCLHRLMDACGLDKHQLNEPRSGTGFMNGLIEADRIGLMVLDEVGRYLGNAMNANSSGFQREIIDYIIKSFSKANSMLLGLQYADSHKNPPIKVRNPHLCILGSSVREKIVEACRASDIIDGFLNRWILFESDYQPRRRGETRISTPPEALVAKIKYLMSEPARYASDQYAEVKVIEFTPEALDLIVKYEDWVEQRIQVVGYPLNAMYGRLAEHVKKLALVLCDNEYIGYHDVRVAIEIVRHSLVAATKFVGNISENTMERDYNKVREIIEKSGAITRNELTRRTQFLLGGDKRRDEILKTMLECNSIVQVEARGAKGKPKVMYKAV